MPVAVLVGTGVVLVGTDVTVLAAARRSTMSPATYDIAASSPPMATYDVASSEPPRGRGMSRGGRAGSICLGFNTEEV